VSAPWWWQALAVASGSALGGLLRWSLGQWLNPLWSVMPVGTLLVNCVGGFLCGAVVLWSTQSPHEWLRLWLMTGFLGGLTTFSAFSAESLLLLQRGAWVEALVHTLAHVVGALACAAGGYRLLRWLCNAP
jgi:fluoride exporter